MRLGALILGLLVLMAPGAWGEAVSGQRTEVLTARYSEPTTRYQHGVLGDAVEWGALELVLDACADCARITRRSVVIRLPATRVFEDIAPRVVDLGGQVGRAAIVVESDLDRGARLAIYGGAGLIDATPYIGQSHRWLAPIGAADLDQDGRVEIAYIDRPHLAKRLRLWQFSGGTLRHLADLDGLTNHRIGWPDIPGGIRTCGAQPEMITANADWSRVMATTYSSSQGLKAREIARYTGKDSLARAMTCRD
nr:VCBS repeat-containing protein [uncultured Roseovarius sp.]